MENSYEKLALMYQGGDNEAINEIVNRYEKDGIFDKVVNRFYPDKDPYTRDEYLSTARIALMKAASNYDLKKGRNFSVYAHKYIVGELKSKRQKIQKERLIKIDKNVKKLESLDAKPTDDEHSQLYNLIADTGTNLQKDAVTKWMLDEIEKLLKILPVREREVIKLFYGINKTNKKHTLKEIKIKLDLSIPQITRLKKIATDKIKYTVADKNKKMSMIKKRSKIGLKSGSRKDNSHDKTKDESEIIEQINLSDKIHEISAVLHKHLNKHFYEIKTTSESEQERFLKITGLFRHKVIIGQDGRPQFNLLERKAKQTLEKVIQIEKFLSAYIENKFDPKESLDIFKFPMKLNVAGFVKKYAPEVTKNGMKEVLRAMGIKEGTIKTCIYNEDEHFKEDSNN